MQIPLKMSPRPRGLRLCPLPLTMDHKCFNQVPFWSSLVLKNRRRFCQQPRGFQIAIPWFQSELQWSWRQFEVPQCHMLFFLPRCKFHSTTISMILSSHRGPKSCCLCNWLAKPGAFYTKRSGKKCFETSLKILFTNCFTHIINKKYS
jgi:hypothetical protein